MRPGNMTRWGVPANSTYGGKLKCPENPFMTCHLWENRNTHEIYYVVQTSSGDFLPYQGLPIFPHNSAVTAAYSLLRQYSYRLLENSRLMSVQEALKLALLIKTPGLFPHVVLTTNPAVKK